MSQSWNRDPACLWAYRLGSSGLVVEGASYQLISDPVESAAFGRRLESELATGSTTPTAQRDYVRYLVYPGVQLHYEQLKTLECEPAQWLLPGWQLKMAATRDVEGATRLGDIAYWRVSVGHGENRQVLVETPLSGGGLFASPRGLEVAGVHQGKKLRGVKTLRLLEKINIWTDWTSVAERAVSSSVRDVNQRLRLAAPIVDVINHSTRYVVGRIPGASLSAISTVRNADAAGEEMFLFIKQSVQPRGGQAFALTTALQVKPTAGLDQIFDLLSIIGVSRGPARQSVPAQHPFTVVFEPTTHLQAGASAPD